MEIWRYQCARQLLKQGVSKTTLNFKNFRLVIYLSQSYNLCTKLNQNRMIFR